MEKVIIVDTFDNEIGTMEKIRTHREGLLHRCFSIFVFNKKNELLMQKRAADKYHSGGLWTNTVCGHPRPGENIIEAAERRLYEEMGIKVNLGEIFTFLYRVDFDNGLIENEYDHVLVGYIDQNPNPDPKEAEDYKWINLPELKHEIAKHPENYTEWLKIIMWNYFDTLNRKHHWL